MWVGNVFAAPNAPKRFVFKIESSDSNVIEINSSHVLFQNLKNFTPIVSSHKSCE